LRLFKAFVIDSFVKTIENIYLHDSNRFPFL
jgi:hypothetical protein